MSLWVLVVDDEPDMSDINTPGMSGFEPLPEAKAIRPEAPIVIIIADDAETKSKALESGAEALLTKPIDFGAVRGGIEMRIGQAA